MISMRTTFQYSGNERHNSRKKGKLQFLTVGEIFWVKHNPNPAKACICQYTVYWFICRHLNLFLVLVYIQSWFSGSLFQINNQIQPYLAVFEAQFLSIERGWCQAFMSSILFTAQHRHKEQSMPRISMKKMPIPAATR